MNAEDVNKDTQVVLGKRVYEVKDLFKLFDVRGVKYEVLEDEVAE